MATIAENLQTILNIKNDIKSAIIAKGVSVADDDGFATYPDKIESIETGGGSSVLESITITENGTYTPNEGVDGYNEVNVNVSATPKINVQDNSIKFAYSGFIRVPEWAEFNSTLIDMSYMFYGCPSLKNISLPYTVSVNKMEKTFMNCTVLQEVEELNTSNVYTMDSMFYGCSKLTTIPQLNTSKVTNMGSMFYNCSKLTTIPQLNTGNVTSMYQMFRGCSSLTTIPQLNTSKVTNMNNMFYFCNNLQSIPQIDTSKVDNMSGMFYGCKLLTTIPLLDVSNVTNISSFFGSSNITSLTDLGGFKNLKINWTDSGSLTKLPNITYESVMNVINNLYDFRGNGDTTTTRTIKFNANSVALLSESDIAIATNKGWTIS